MEGNGMMRKYGMMGGSGGGMMGGSGGGFGGGSSSVRGRSLATENFSRGDITIWLKDDAISPGKWLE